MSIWDGTFYECGCFKEWTILFFIGMALIIILTHFLKWLTQRKDSHDYRRQSGNEESLKDICKDLNIPWTDNPDDINKMINNKLDEALEKEKRRKDL